ncbi:helix-turn-helix domain-containing protein [Leifsonia shinshuensis]
MSALLALPALWVDHDPREIANGLLSVLTGMLQLDSAYVRFADAAGDLPLEVWRPSGARPPAELTRALGRSGRAAADGAGVPGAGTVVADAGVVTLPIALPWESGTVAVAASRADFPTAAETQLLRVAVGQAAIAIHTARRLAQESAARRAAEDALLRQHELLRALSEQVAPELAALARRVQDAGRPDPGSRPEPGAVRGGPPALTDREAEVLGLLAQGLSNKEIAAALWLSDRTVERHITSLYRKIGVARRSEATAFALRHGVV